MLVSIRENLVQGKLVAAAECFAKVGKASLFNIERNCSGWYCASHNPQRTRNKARCYPESGVTFEGGFSLASKFGDKISAPQDAGALGIGGIRNEAV